MSDEYIFIVDIGSSSVKAGYSAEDSPSNVFPSTLIKAPRTIEVNFIYFFYFLIPLIIN
jgi:actin-related protein